MKRTLVTFIIFINLCISCLGKTDCVNGDLAVLLSRWCFILSFIFYGNGRQEIFYFIC
jgi:hypothetical protein